MAHELGHYCYNHGPSNFENNIDTQNEKDANAFAEELLIPEKALKDQLKI